MARITLDPELIPGTLGVRWEYNLNGTPISPRDNLEPPIHLVAVVA